MLARVPTANPGGTEVARNISAETNIASFNRLAMIAQPGGNVHRVAVEGDLPLRITALADDDGPCVNTGAKPRRDTEFRSVGRHQLAHSVFGGEKTGKRAGISVAVVVERPGDDPSASPT